MEGVGSRLGRVSSRYGPATTVFNGPVRKWKKKWVHVSSSSTVSYQNPHSQSNGQSSTTSSNGGSSLLLCRWTPIPPSTTSSATEDSVPVNGPGGELDEPPKRKFRYAPVRKLVRKHFVFVLGFGGHWGLLEMLGFAIKDVVYFSFLLLLFE